MSVLHPDFESEETRLREILDFLRVFYAETSEKKEDIDALVSYSLKHYNSDNSEQFVELLLNTANQDALTKKTAEARYALNKPYFARVDFIPEDRDEAQQYYIGKMTLMRELDILITDWRAPVSSLYYEGRIGHSSYDCPDGLIEGEITLKRQFAIEKGRLEAVTDIDITTNDAFLQAALGASKDRRLKDIVTTIQAEQNCVIRADLYTPLIVQGVAGGGKTTIALHRIAYLLYAYEGKLLPRHVMIMAPNRFFLSYISDVLPDLGVERVTQTTFEDFAAECIELNMKKWKINPAVQAIASAVGHPMRYVPEMDMAKFKSDLRFMTLIDRYCSQIEREVLPTQDLVLEGYELFAHEAITDLFLREYNYLPVAKRAGEIHKHLTNTLRKEKPLILAHIEREYDGILEAIKRSEPDSPQRRSIIIECLNDRDDKIKRVKNKARVIIRQYMRAFTMKTAVEYYRALYEETNTLSTLANGLFTAEECEQVRVHTLAVLSASHLDMEDLPPLLWMRVKLFGIEDDLDIKHVVIDEAQDFSLFQLMVLKKLTVNASFSILGDLHQGIYAYKGIRDWSEINPLFPGIKPSYLTLEQSYRTTVEIMEAANPVISRLNGNEMAVPLAVPVIRHGDPVTIINASNRADWADAINQKIIACQKDGYRSVAVIGKTLEECRVLRKSIKSPSTLITGREEKYEGGLLILPVWLVKGLEFDAVLIADVSDECYGDYELDIKLLYIAMTRALHSLTLFALGEPGELVRNALIARSV